MSKRWQPVNVTACASCRKLYCRHSTQCSHLVCFFVYPSRFSANETRWSQTRRICRAAPAAKSTQPWIAEIAHWVNLMLQNRFWSGSFKLWGFLEILSGIYTTTGHPYKLYTSHCTSIRSRFFAHRVIKAWNILPQSTNFSSIAAFKRSILQTDHSKHLTMLFVWCRGVDYLV